MYGRRCCILFASINKAIVIYDGVHRFILCKFCTVCTKSRVMGTQLAPEDRKRSVSNSYRTLLHHWRMKIGLVSQIQVASEKNMVPRTTEHALKCSRQFTATQMPNSPRPFQGEILSFSAHLNVTFVSPPAEEQCSRKLCISLRFLTSWRMHSFSVSIFSRPRLNLRKTITSHACFVSTE